jgi:hypothetical protein
MAIYVIRRAWRNAKWGFLAVALDGQEWVLRLPWADLQGLSLAQIRAAFRDELIRVRTQEAEATEQSVNVTGTIDA